MVLTGQPVTSLWGSQPSYVDNTLNGVFWDCSQPISVLPLSNPIYQTCKGMNFNTTVAVLTFQTKTFTCKLFKPTRHGNPSIWLAYAATQQNTRAWWLFKEQSPSPRVLLFQTMPEGLPEGCQSETTKPEGNGDCSYYNTCFCYWWAGFVSQQNPLLRKVPSNGFCWLTKPANTAMWLAKKLCRVIILEQRIQLACLLGILVSHWRQAYT